MNEYIEKAAIIPALEDYYEPINPDFPMTLELGQISEVLQNIPAANVAEVRHGRWIPEICESISKRNRLIEYKVYSCSLCGRSNGRVKKKYCPNCGALMKEDEHEAD